MSSARTRITGLKTLAIGAALFCGFILALSIAASPARAAEEPFAIQFDQSTIDAQFLGGLSLDELSGPSSIEGTIDEQGNVKIPRGKFQLPVIDVSGLGQSLVGIEVPIEIEGFMGIEQPATGTFDPATGKLEIDAKAGLWVSINIQQALAGLGGLGVSLPPELGAITGFLGENLTCGFSPMDVTFTTESTSLGEGQRFTKGLKGPGALTTEWSQLGPFAGKTRILGLVDACTTIRGLIPGLLSGIGGGTGIDLGGIDLAGLLSQLDELDLGPSGLTVTRTVDESPAPAELAVSAGPKRKVVRSGRAARIMVAVSNQGGTVSTRLSVCAVPFNRQIRGGGCRILAPIAPGQTSKRRFTLTMPRSKKVRKAKVMFNVRTGNTVLDSSTVWITKSKR